MVKVYLRKLLKATEVSESAEREMLDLEVLKMLDLEVLKMLDLEVLIFEVLDLKVLIFEVEEVLAWLVLL